MNTLILKPKPGRRVLDPAQTPPTPLPPEGRRVVDSPYWRSRLADGVVERVETLGAPPQTPQGEARPQPGAPDPIAQLEAAPPIAEQSVENNGGLGGAAPPRNTRKGA